MALSIPALSVELTTDPAGLGYASLLAEGNDQGPADLLNCVRDGVTPPPAPYQAKPVGAAIIVRRPNIAPSEVLEAIDTRDFDATAVGAILAWFESATRLPQMRLLNDDGTTTRVLGNLRRLITSDVQGSRTRLNAIANRNGSRAEQLFGVGTFVTAIDIAAALGRG